MEQEDPAAEGEEESNNLAYSTEIIEIIHQYLALFFALIEQVIKTCLNSKHDASEVS
jgi:hypothetical protein